ncbi:MAG: valine--tRNA ligase [Polyangiales bacterium]
MSSSDFSKPYDPKDVEPRWRARAEASGWYAARDVGAHEDSFCIMIPPPNVTGSLHMGHALFITLQDAMVRHARMHGKNTLWLPGVDHAGIATQVVVERELRREGLTRHDLGRERFIDRVWEWKRRSGDRIFEQLKVMGASPDWSRAKFTMDPDLSAAVREAFVRLHEQGLMYRANRMVNWCPTCRTVLSDLEVDREEPEAGRFNSELFSFAYKLSDGSGEIVVATTRPETMLGDLAIAVHPDDPRYRDLIGKTVRHPFVDREFPIIADAILADPTKGTGAVKITPAHDFNDFECGRRHGLGEITILNPDGTLNAEGGPFAGMDRFAAREAVKKALEEKGLARGSAPHNIAYALCQRSKDILEPTLSPQWYVKMQPLAEPAVKAVEEGRTVFVPEEWTKTYMHWMTHIQDWCVSRQLWWGHQIPAWYCADCGGTTVQREDPSACQHCGSAKITQDEDVLDTWFSSALWPFSTLGWPAETDALKTFYPTTVMETGYDIIFFWVARMMMMGIHFMGEVPFSRVLLHGLVCDENGQKMSKVKGNVIDPLDLVHGATVDQVIANAVGKRVSGDAVGLDAADRKKFLDAYPSVGKLPEGFRAFGADALRFYLGAHAPQSRKINLNLSRLQGYRDFCNKIWNATRFALTHIADVAPRPTGDFPTPHSLAERWILSRLAAAVEGVENGITQFRLDEATSAVYQFFWYELCDWFLELCKPVFDAGSDAEKASYKLTLAHCLEVSHRLMHPLMPHLTEECWSHLPDAIRRRRSDGVVPEALAVAAFPNAGDARRDLDAERVMGVLQDTIEGVRRICAELGIKPGAAITVRLRTADPRYAQTFHDYEGALRRLTRAREVVVEAPGERPRGVGYASIHGVEVLIPLAGHIDPAKEGERLEKDVAKARKESDGITRRLANANFIANAPAEVVEKDQARVRELTERIERLGDALAIVRELG